MAATVTISVEIELAWGFHDVADAYPHLSSGRRAETRRLKQLLALCDELSIPISFDTVGYLFNETYEPIADSPHPADWLPVSPGSDIETDPLFYGKDLIDHIAATSQRHEVCSHTYTHPILDQVPAEVVAWELDTARETHRRYGLEPPVSLVPPQHAPPPDRLMRAGGFEVVRSAVSSRIPSNIHQYYHFLTRTQPVRDPVERDGIVHTYCTQNTSLTSPLLPAGQKRPHAAVRALPAPVRRHLHLRFLHSSLREAIRTDSSVHYWSHLFNLANDVQWPLARQFLSELARHRDDGDVEIRRMKDLVAGPAQS